VDGVRQLADAGVAAVVLPSLFEEQVRREAERDARLAEAGGESFAESLSYLPDTGGEAGPRRYLDLVSRAAAAVGIPVIASLNGVTADGWVDYATAMQNAGAAAIELNIYYLPGDPHTSGRDVEQRHLDILTRVKAAVTVPVAVKLSPYFSSFANMAASLDALNVDGLVLFNRFYQPDIDLEKMEVAPNLTLSTPADMRLPLHWIGILYGKIRANLAATTGVYQAQDVIKLIMAGADVTMLCSALMRYGITHIQRIEMELIAWLEQHQHKSLRELKGVMSQQNCPDPSAFERAQYVRGLSSYTSLFPMRR